MLCAPWPEYRDRLGYRGQLLLESARRAAPSRRPCPCPCCGEAEQHGERGGHLGRDQQRYDDCAAAAVCLLKQHGLDRHYKLSAPPGHQAVVSAA